MCFDKLCKKNNNGFTLAELLVVVAIIAVLVAVSIPVFSTQLEKSREATDIANLRSAYAEAMAMAYTSEDQTGFAYTPYLLSNGKWEYVDNQIAGGEVEAINKGENNDFKCLGEVIVHLNANNPEYYVHYYISNPNTIEGFERGKANGEIVWDRIGDNGGTK